MKNYFLLLIVFSFFMTVVPVPVVSQTEAAQPGETHPNMFLNQAEIDAIRARIAAGDEPWTSAFQALIAQADAALTMEPPSVVGGAIPYHPSEANWYFSCAPSSVDNNPRCDNRHDYRQAIAVSHTVRDLALAYAFTDIAQYAEKALELIRAWMLDPDTYMEPRFRGDQSIIELSITLPGLFYGIDLIWHYPGWDADEKAAVQAWVSTFGWQATTEYTEVWETYGQDANFENWKNSLIAAAGVVAEDPALRQFAWDWYRTLIPLQYDAPPNTSMVDGVDNCRRWGDFGRGSGLFYSLFGLRGQIATAEIARHFGVDLYSYNDPETGRGLECALDFHVGFLLDPTTWPWSQNREITPDIAVVYLLGYLWQPKPEYLAVIEHYNWASDNRYLGMLQLTHGFRAFSWQLWDSD